MPGSICGGAPRAFSISNSFILCCNCSILATLLVALDFALCVGLDPASNQLLVFSTPSGSSVGKSPWLEGSVSQGQV